MLLNFKFHYIIQGDFLRTSLHDRFWNILLFFYSPLFFSPKFFNTLTYFPKNLDKRIIVMNTKGNLQPESWNSFFFFCYKGIKGRGIGTRSPFIKILFFNVTILKIGTKTGESVQDAHRTSGIAIILPRAF